MLVIDTEAASHHLGMPEMDETHQEFIDLVNMLSGLRGKEFERLFNEFIQHTEAHFAREKVLMEESGFPALSEHVAEHQRILGELEQHRRRVSKGATAFACAYVRERIPEWFSLHLATMDSALVHHLGQLN